MRMTQATPFPPIPHVDVSFRLAIPAPGTDLRAFTRFTYARQPRVVPGSPSPPESTWVPTVTGGVLPRSGAGPHAHPRPLGNHTRAGGSYGLHLTSTSGSTVPSVG